MSLLSRSPADESRVTWVSRAQSESFHGNDAAWISQRSYRDALADGLLVNRAVYI